MKTEETLDQIQKRVERFIVMEHRSIVIDGADLIAYAERLAALSESLPHCIRDDVIRVLEPMHKRELERQSRIDAIIGPLYPGI